MGKIENVDCVERACVIFIGSISSPADKKISSVRQVSNPLFCMGVFLFLFGLYFRNVAISFVVFFRPF